MIPSRATRSPSFLTYITTNLSQLKTFNTIHRYDHDELCQQFERGRPLSPKTSDGVRMG